MDHSHNQGHNHKAIYRKTFLSHENFDFHSKLKEWLEKYWRLSPEESITVQELGCDDNSCPVYETIVMAYLPGKDTPRILKLGKAKHLLTKQDIVFSVEKQKS
ncbi:MAG: hypothetical protein JJT78_12685 [Leptospira sp.]|nr:hypothetical protein [Leptospira sp.]